MRTDRGEAGARRRRYCEVGVHPSHHGRRERPGEGTSFTDNVGCDFSDCHLPFTSFGDGAPGAGAERATTDVPPQGPLPGQVPTYQPTVTDPTTAPGPGRGPGGTWPGGAQGSGGARNVLGQGGKGQTKGRGTRGSDPHKQTVEEALEKLYQDLVFDYDCASGETCGALNQFLELAGIIPFGKLTKLKKLDAARGVAKGAKQAGVVLTRGGRKVLGTLESLKDSTVAVAIRKRGGGGKQVNFVATDLQQALVGEVANLAAKGDAAAVTAIKIIKDAGRLARK